MSAATINQPVAVPERVVRAMRLITLAAEQSLPAPKNDELAAALGANSVSAGANIVALLETMGLIAVTRYQVGRLITINSSGKSTRDPGGKLHWSVRGVVRTKSRPPEPKHGDNPQHAGRYRGPIPESQLVDRDGCPWCGVRGDIGCHHRPPPIAERVSA